MIFLQPLDNKDKERNISLHEGMNTLHNMRDASMGHGHPTEKIRIKHVGESLSAYVNSNTFDPLQRPYPMPRFCRGMDVDINAIEQLFLGDVPYDDTTEVLVRYYRTINS